MIAALAIKLLEAWLLCAVVQLVLWLIAQRTKNAGIVDVGWAACFTLVVGVFALTTDAPRAGYLPIGAIVVVWSTRLAGYLVARGAATGNEEGRYRDLRSRWGLNASRKLFGFFQAQAALTALLSTAFVVPFVAAPWPGGGGIALRVIGAAIALGAVIGEALADAQLARWKREPANRGRVCDVGLWSWSRHPNYFFEWLIWVGFALFAIDSPYGWASLISPALILYFLLRVTGIPATEAQALRSRGDEYRRYQQTTSAFVPWPPKRGTA